MASERRHYQRVPESRECELADQEGGLAPRIIRLVDLSLMGVGFETDLPLELGQVIEFALPTGISVKAKVIRAGEPGLAARYGAEFEEMSFPERRLLRAYLLERMEQLGLEPLDGDYIG